MEVWLKHHIPFWYGAIFPVFNKISLVQDKARVAEITSNDMAACDRMFIPEFMELLKYVEQRFTERYGLKDDMVPLGSF